MIITGILDFNSDTIQNGEDAQCYKTFKNQPISNQSAICLGHILSTNKVKYAMVEVDKSFDRKLFSRYLKELESCKYQYVIVIIKDVNHYVNELIKIKFDILIMGVDNEEMLSGLPEDCLNQLVLALNKNGYIILNADYTLILNAVRGIQCQFITVGYNSKASITTSSIGDFIENEFFLCSLQRNITSLSGKIILPQEIKSKSLPSFRDNVYTQLVVVAFALITELKLDW